MDDINTQAGQLPGHPRRGARPATSTASVDPARHDCPAEGDMQHQAQGMGGELWRCRRCHRPWTKVDKCFYEPGDAALAEQVDR
jgi:hypothetical protein